MAVGGDSEHRLGDGWHKASSFRPKMRVIGSGNDAIKIQVTGDVSKTYKVYYSNDLKTEKLFQI